MYLENKDKDMRNITILKVYTSDHYTYDSYYNDSSHTFVTAVANAEFQEVSDEIFAYLFRNLSYIQPKNNEFQYVIVECKEQKELINNLIININEYAQKLEEQEKVRLEKEQKEQEIKKLKSLERKRKQLEKLQKELNVN